MCRLDPAYRASFADGSEIQVRAGHEAMREEIAATCGPVDAAAFDDFVVWLRELYDLEMPHFIDRNFDSPLDLVSAPRVAARLLRLGGFRSPRAGGRGAVPRPAAAPAVQLPGDVCGPAAEPRPAPSTR